MTRNFEAAKADILDALEKRNIDSRQFYKQYLSYLENYVHEFESACVLNRTEEFFLTAAATATELFEPDPDIGTKQLEKQQILSTLAELCCKEGSDNGVALNTLEDWFAVLQNSEYAEDTNWRLLGSSLRLPKIFQPQCTILQPSSIPCQKGFILRRSFRS